MIKTLIISMSAAVILVSASSIRAERQVLDRVVAVVEDYAIFQSDVEQVIKQYMFEQRETNPTQEEVEQLANKVLQDLINDKLVIAQAARLDIDVTFADVEQKVDEALERNRELVGGQEVFEEQLAREGFTLDELKKLYRQQVRNRMLVERVLQMEMSKEDRTMTDDDLRGYYDAHLDELPKRPGVVHLSTILIGYESSVNASGSARSKIDAVHAELMRGESFVELAKKHSEDPSAPMGGDLGFLQPEDLREPAFRDAAMSLGIGEISEPVLTSYGYHIITVAERNPDTGEARIRHILIRINPSENDVQEVFELANDVYAQLQAGAAFEDLADKYGTDPTAGPGGDLGWLKGGDLPPFFQDVLASMVPGDVSQVLREQSGFRIVRLIDREPERPYEYEEVKNDLRRLYEADVMGEAYNDYVLGLRERFTVVVMPAVN
jgi:peptidyl-prolyl cis-trans isomerase SurA